MSDLVEKGNRVLIKTKGKNEWTTRGTCLKAEDEFGLVKVLLENGIVIKNKVENIKLDGKS